MEIIVYLTKASAVILLFYLVYLAFIKRDTFHNFKRGFLLFGLVISVILPLLNYHTYVDAEPPIQEEVFTPTVSFTQNVTTSKTVIPQIEARPSKPINWIEVFTYIYFSVAFFTLTFLMLNYLKLSLKIRKFKFVKKENLKIYEVENLKSPFSFFNNIIINKSNKNTTEQQMIIAHEKVHVTHYHWIDIFLSNLFLAAFWFNPFLWLYRKEIKQNLEHIADSQAIKNLENKKSYQYLLLNQVLPIPQNFAESYFFQPSIKQRIMMINKSQSSNFKMLKGLLIVPFLVFFFINFQNKVIAQEVGNEKNKESESKDESIINRFVENISDSLKRRGISISKNVSFNSLPEITYSVKNVSYKDEENPLLSKKSQLDPKTHVEKPFEVLNEPAVKSNVIYGKGNKVLILKISKKADQEYLDYVKTLFRNKYKIYLTYRNVHFDENNQLTSLDLSVLTRDAKTVDYKIDTKNPIEDIYFYRDYSKGTTPEIGIVNTLPEFPKETKKGELLTKIQIGPGDDHKISTKNDASRILNLKNVETFIINGMTYEADKLDDMVVLVKKYKLIDQNTLDVEGDVFRGNEIDEFFKANNKASLKVENASMISFKKGEKPFAMLVNQKPNDIAKDLKPKKKQNKILEIVNDGEVSRLIITINKNSNKEYLDYIEKYLKEEHDIKMKTSKIKYNNDGLLTSIKVQIKTNDGFKGSASQIKSRPINEFYIFRDFSKNTKVPFGIGSELPTENKKDIEGRVISTFKISPEGYKAENSTPRKQKSINIDKVEKFIINGEEYGLFTEEPMMVIIESYEFIKENKLKITGEVLRNEGLKKFYKNDYESKNPNGSQIIFFHDYRKPLSINLIKTEITKMKNN